MMNYQTHVDNGSMFNTPPTYAIYIMGLVFQWLKKNGGIDAIEKVNREKAKILYDFLDSSSLFKGTVAVKDRSLMNVPFVTGNEETDAAFIKERRRFCQPERPPQRRRYARQYLQRHAAERRAGAC